MLINPTIQTADCVHRQKSPYAYTQQESGCVGAAFDANMSPIKMSITMPTGAAQAKGTRQ